MYPLGVLLWPLLGSRRALRPHSEWGLGSAAGKHKEPSTPTAFSLLSSSLTLFYPFLDDHSSEVLCWGVGLRGELGLGEKAGPFRVPIVNQLLRGIPVRQVHTGAYHAHITTEDRRVLSYGWNASGQCGVDSTEQVIKVPTEITVFRGSTILMMASGAMHSHFATADGSFWSVGNNAFGQLGLNSLIDAFKPAQVVLPTSLSSRSVPIRVLTCGDFFTVAIWGESSAYSWGRNNLCQTGGPRTNCVRKLERCWALSRRAGEVSMVACGSDHAAFLMQDGTVEMFGSNAAKQFGQFLTGERSAGLAKISLSGFTGARIISIAACGNATTALDSDGILHMWGSRHTLHHGTREGLAEHPEVIWRTPENESVRLVRMGRNHLHILTRSGMLYSWVYGRIKQTPCPFLPKTYFNYYQAKYETQGLRTVAGSAAQGGQPGDAVVVVAQRPAHPASQTDSLYGLVHEQVPEAIAPQMAQLEDVQLEEAWDDETEFRVVDAPLVYLNEPSDSESSEGESEEDADDDRPVQGVDQEAPAAADRQRRIVEVPNPGADDDGTRVALPRKPWKSFFVGQYGVKDLVCGAFTTQILLFGKHFASEFRPLFASPEQYFPDVELELADGSKVHVHKFWMHQRCPALVSKSSKKSVLATVQPSLVHLVLKSLYYEHRYVSDLSDEQLRALQLLLKQLKLHHSPLAKSLTTEISYRANELRSSEISQDASEKARTQFQTQMQRMYELHNYTDYTLVASQSPAPPETSEAEDAEKGEAGPTNAILVHRAILAIRVPFFEALFHSRFSDSQNASHEFDCNIQTLDHLLRYIYYDFTNFSVESALWILRQSELLFVDKPRERLVSACSGILRRAGRGKELKQVLASINPNFDPYEEGKELPDFARRSTADLTVNPADIPTYEAESESTIERPSTSFAALEESVPSSKDEVELQPIKPKNTKPKKSRPKDKPVQEGGAVKAPRRAKKTRSVKEEVVEEVAED